MNYRVALATLAVFSLASGSALASPSSPQVECFSIYKKTENYGSKLHQAATGIDWLLTALRMPPSLQTHFAKDTQIDFCVDHVTQQIALFEKSQDSTPTLCVRFREIAHNSVGDATYLVQGAPSADPRDELRLTIYSGIGTASSVGEELSRQLILTAARKGSENDYLLVQSFDRVLKGGPNFDACPGAQ